MIPAELAARFSRLNAWARRARILAPFMVGGPLLTAVFWSIFGIFVVAIGLTPVLTFGDLNYHLALAAVLRRMASPDAPERQIFETNLFSYNGAFQILVAGLGFVMSIERAGQVVFCGFWLGLCLATIALLRALDQRTERAFIVFPLFLTTPAGWGFVNYCVAVALQLYALARVIRRPRVGVSIRYDAITSLVALLGLLSHLFATGVIYSLILVTLIVRTIADKAPIMVRYGRTLREGLAFLPPLLAAYAMHLRQRHIKSPDPDLYKDFYAVKKVKDFFAFACDFFADKGDQTRLFAAVAILAVCAIFRTTRRAGPYPTLKGWLFGTALFIYLLMPEYSFQVAVLFQRLPLIVVLCFAAAVPRANKWLEKGVAVGLAVIGLRCAAAFLGLRLAQLPDMRDLERVVAEAPAGRRLAVHVPYNALARQLWPGAGHCAQYYVTRKGFESSINYANKPSSPVHYRVVPSLAPDAVARGEIPYSPHAAYAKRFDLVMVRTLDPDPAPKIWGARSGEVELVSHHGSWWLFDARRYFGNP